MYPLNTFNRLARLSAIPSIRPTIAGVAPNDDVKYKGIIGYTISALISAKKLINPKKTTFDTFVTPSIIVQALAILYQINFKITIKNRPR